MHVNRKVRAPFGCRSPRYSRPSGRCASPPINRTAIRRPLASASASIFVLRPPRERPTACFCSPPLQWISPFSAIDQRTAAALSGLTALARQTGGFPKKPKSQANHLWIWRKTPGAGAGGISPYVVYAASALILTSRVGCAAAARTERRQHASDAISDNHVIVDSFAHGMWCRTHQSLTWR